MRSETGERVIIPALESRAARRNARRRPDWRDTLLQRTRYDAYVVMLHARGMIAAKLLRPIAPPR